MIFDDITKGIRDLLSKEEKEIKESSPITEGPSPSQLFTSYIKTGNEIFKEAAGEALKTMKENASPIGMGVIGVGAMMTPKGRAVAGKTIFEGFKDISSTALEKLAGKSVVSRQFIEDSLKQAGTRAADADMIRAELAITPGDKIDVAEFANRVKENQILPLNIKTMPSPRYERIQLPTAVQMPSSSYRENIYESPISNTAGMKHFSYRGNSSVNNFSSVAEDSADNYFAHTRTRDLSKQTGDMAIRRDPGTIREVLEVQSDLMQKGGLEKLIKRQLDYIDEAIHNLGVTKEYKYKYSPDVEKKLLTEFTYDLDKASMKKQELERLLPYTNTWYERIVREEVKRAAMDGMEKLRFPTGETAMKIEGLGQESRGWVLPDEPLQSMNRGYPQLDSNNLKVGLKVRNDYQDWIITDVLGDGKFKAVPKKIYEEYNPEKIADYKLLREEPVGMGDEQRRVFYTDGQGRTQDILLGYFADTDKFLKQQTEIARENVSRMHRLSKETFDISGKVDTKNPIYEFYEKEMKKFLTNKFNAKEVTDEKGVTWLEVTPQAYKSQPVMAHGMASMDTILKGGMISMGGIVGAGAVAGTVENMFGNKTANSTPSIAEPILSAQAQETTQAQPAQQPETTEETAVKPDTSEFRKDLTHAILFRENRGEILRGGYLYDEIGPTGDMGKYQVSPKTLNDWSEPWLGKYYTKQEFLDDPAAQEEFYKQFLDVVDAYKVTKEEAMIMWHRGFGVLGNQEDRETKKKKLREYLDKTMPEEESQDYLHPEGGDETSSIFQKSLAMAGMGLMAVTPKGRALAGKGLMEGIEGGIKKLFRSGKLDDVRGTGIFLSSSKPKAISYETTGAGGKQVAEYSIPENVNLVEAENRWQLVKSIDPKWDKEKVHDKFINEQMKNGGKLVNNLTAEQRLAAEAEKRIKSIFSKEGIQGVKYTGGVTDQGGEYQIFDSKILQEGVQSVDRNAFRIKLLKHIYDPDEYYPEGEAAKLLNYSKLGEKRFKHKALKPADIPDWARKESQDSIEGDTITLYHGAVGEQADTIKAGSWSTDPDVARRFTNFFRSGQRDGEVIKMEIPKDKILLHYNAFPDLKEESEVLVDEIALKKLFK